MGKGGGGMSPEVQQGMLQNETALTGIAEGQAAHATSLWDLTSPGLGTAENFYTSLASGDPSAIMKAIAPTAEAAGKSSAAAKSNIMANAPSGGEKNLALEMTDVNRASQVSGAASSASLNAPNALATLAGQGISEGVASAGAGTSALSAGSQTLSSLGGMQIQEQQIAAQEKGNILGAGSNLGGGLFKAAGEAGSFAELFA